MQEKVGKNGTAGRSSFITKLVVAGAGEDSWASESAPWSALRPYQPMGPLVRLGYRALTNGTTSGVSRNTVWPITVCIWEQI